jgi:hypothetical protein
MAPNFIHFDYRIGLALIRVGVSANDGTAGRRDMNLDPLIQSRVFTIVYILSSPVTTPLHNIEAV